MKTYGHVVYGCAACCGWSGATLWYNPIGVPFGGLAYDGVWMWYACESEYDDMSSSFYNNWTSGNTSIVTVNAYGTHTGVALGSTTSQTQGCVPDNDAHHLCPNLCPKPVGGANGTPTVSFTGAGYVPLRTGSSQGPNSTTYTASGNPSGGSFSWSASNSNVTLTNANTATVTVTAATKSTNFQDTTITVTYTYSGQQGTMSANITVVQPSSLANPPTTDSTNPSGHTCLASASSNTCTQSKFSGTGSYSSYLRNRTYKILDQFGNWISGYPLDIEESFTSPTGQCASDEVQIGAPSTGDTVTDCFYFCSATCQQSGSCSVSATQTATVNGYSVRTESVTWSCSSVTLSP